MYGSSARANLERVYGFPFVQLSEASFLLGVKCLLKDFFKGKYSFGLGLSPYVSQPMPFWFSSWFQILKKSNFLNRSSKAFFLQSELMSMCNEN